MSRIRISVVALIGPLHACNDAALTKFNAAPTATITSHSPDADGQPPTVNEGELTEFAGRVSDPDDGFEDLLATWYLGDDPLCAASQPDTEGQTTCTGRPQLDTDSVRLVVSDPYNSTATTSVRLEVLEASAPSAEITAPEASARYYTDLRVAFAGQVSDEEDAPASLTVRWTSDLDGALDTADSPDSSGALVGRTTLSEGQHLITLQVTDSTGKTATDDVTINVGPPNRPPDCSFRAPSEGAIVASNEPVAITGFTADAEAQMTELYFRLSSDLDGILAAGTPEADGTIQHEATGLSLGQHLLTLTVEDELGDTCEASRSITVDSAPAFTITSPADGARINDDTAIQLTGQASDAQDPLDTLTVRWSSDLDGELDTTPPAVDGSVDGGSVTLSAGTHALSLSGTDSAGLSGSSSITLVVNGLPTAPAIAIEPATPTSEDDLTAVITTDSVDPEGDAITYVYGWTRNGAATSHTTASIPASETVRGDEWVVVVTPNDSDGSGAPATTAVTVGNSPPVVDGATLTPSTPTTEDLLTVTATASDTDSDSVSFTYEWFVNGSSTGETTTALDGDVWFEKHDNVWVDVAATDGTDTSSTYTSSIVTIANTPPTAPTIALSPTSPRSANDDILCEVTATSSDADGDTLSYAFDWTVDGVSYSGATDTALSSLVPAADVDAYEVWSCTVTPNDGDDDGTTATASVTTVKGFAGWSSSVVSLSSADWFFTGEDLSDYAGWSVGPAGDVDADGYPDLLIGAYNAGDGPVRTGMAYVVAGSSLAGTGTLDLSLADWRLIGENGSDQAGRWTTTAGDVDADGYADLLIGAPSLNGNGSNEGGLYVFVGGDLGTTADTQLYDAQARLLGEGGGDRAGEAASAAGDIDGDGLDDIIVGAYSNDDAGAGAGKAYLLLGSGLSGDIDLADADFGWTGEAAGDAAGASVAGLGDVDGDGTDDLLVGAWGNDDTAANAGKAYIVLGSSLPADGAPLSSASITLLGEGLDDFAAYSVAAPGDVDGDGRPDVLLGAYGDAPTGSRSGRSYLVYASTLSGVSTLSLGDADHAFSGEAGGDLSGIRVSPAGDVDADGLADLMIAAPANDDAGSNAGKVYLMLAGNLPTTTNIGLSTADYAFTGESIGDQAGYGLAAPGDVNGDGFDDLMIGSWGENSGGLDAGTGYLLLSP